MNDPIDDLLTGSFGEALRQAPDLTQQVDAAMRRIRRRERLRLLTFGIATIVASAIVALNLAELANLVVPAMDTTISSPGLAAMVLIAGAGTWFALMLDSA